MKSFSVLVVSILLLVPGISLATFDWFGGRLSIGGGYGRAKPKLPYSFQDSHQDGQMWTAHMKYFLSDRFSVVVSYADLVADERGAVRKLRFRPIVGSLRLNIFRGLPVTPYLTIGGGVSRNLKEVVGGPNIKWTKITGQGGVGFEFFINQGTSLGAEALYHHVLAENSQRAYGVGSLVGTVNVYFGEGPATRRARQEAETARAEAERQAAEAAASQRAAREAEEKAQAMQARAQTAQKELDEIKKMVERKDISPVNFATGSATLLGSSFLTLGKVAESVKKYPDLKLQVEGHTDSQGSDALNLRLSQERAESVRDYLVGHGVPTNQIKAVGFGETRPIAPNVTSDGRLRNRRVEFLFNL